MDEIRTVAIVQSRMDDAELRGKAMLPILDRPLLDWVIQRTRRASRISEVIVTTTDSVLNDPIEYWCVQNRIRMFRTGEGTLLDRFVQVAAWVNADHVVRIGGDCPLVDPQLIDAVVGQFHTDRSCDWCSNYWPERHYPLGTEVECFSLDALRRVNDMADTPELREQLNLAVCRNASAFRISSVCSAVDHSTMNWRVDGMPELELVRTIADWFENDEFSWGQAVELCRRNWPRSRIPDKQQSRRVA